ncbi:LysE family translocator [Reinekea forsetii]|jgi:threonine/homoserine/homoserine lactone efflux protein|uniref:Threonine transporter RhtB n=1 Tax=Reinekea forsetii TaxID=1336806 RepID=A0A2K8L2F7_9GAMM|nr:LysE family translocator [Reinekea forsetii]ATX78436.1 threonine transporter RhtB [Reinekea forsetii]MDO7642236.1 LysE family translocator [Reinekea forsetii]MDO7644721.1 LysE family translocator [Reinekea forsetii]
MLNLTLLAAFVPTFMFVSFTPGMCMTLAMTLGITIGVKRTLWMMFGELIGVGLIAAAAVLGVAALLLAAPWVFTTFRWLGGAYLVWLGLQMWRSRGKMAIPEDLAGAGSAISRRALFSQGFITAIANPKGWAFFMVLLPPFLDQSLAMAPQLSALIAIILLIELCALLIYALGGATLNRLLQKSSNVRLLNRIAGTLMLAVGVWLALG